MAYRKRQPAFGRCGFSWRCGSRPRLRWNLRSMAGIWNNFPFVLWRRPTFISRWCRHGMRFHYADTVAKLRRVADSFVAFTLAFRHIGYGPEPRRPRFLWAECVASNEIAELRAALLRAFGQADERPFRPHVTLARLRDKGRAIARKHPVDQTLRSRSGSNRSSSCNRPLPVGAATKCLRHCRLARIGN